MPPAAKTCGSCGAHGQSGAFCDECGQTLPETTSASSASESAPSFTSSASASAPFFTPVSEPAREGRGSFDTWDMPVKPPNSGVHQPRPPSAVPVLIAPLPAVPPPVIGRLRVVPLSGTRMPGRCSSRSMTLRPPRRRRTPCRCFPAVRNRSCRPPCGCRKLSPVAAASPARGAPRPTPSIGITAVVARCRWPGRPGASAPLMVAANA